MAIENETEAPASGVTEPEETASAPVVEESAPVETPSAETESGNGTAPAADAPVAEAPAAAPSPVEAPAAGAEVEEAAAVPIGDDAAAAPPAEDGPPDAAPIGTDDVPEASAATVDTTLVDTSAETAADAPVEDPPAEASETWEPAAGVAEAVPSEAVPSEDGPSEAVASEDGPSEAVSFEDGPAEETPAEDGLTTAPDAAAEVAPQLDAEDSGAVATEGAVADADGEPPAAASDEPSADHHGARPAITAPRDIGHVDDELSADDFAEAIDRTVFDFKEGDIVAGTVVRVDPDEALIDIGYKSEGVIPANELSIRNSASPADVVSVGDEIEALVLQKEDESGRLVLSKKRAQYERAWGRIEGVMAEGGTVNGPVIEVVKGGLIVDIGLRGFLPASLVDLRRVRDLQPFVGENIEAKVIELDKNRNNVVLSRRAYLEEAQAEQRQAFLGDLQPGDVRDGTVSSVVNFGAFVDLGGMDGLVHVSELSWQHVSHPSEVVNVGDKVQVKVLEVDRDRERISLSIRQTKEDPWDMFARETEVGTIIDGNVTKTVPFGAFVSVGDGVEGLVHVSEIAVHHVESPELELSIGQAVRVKVTEVDIDRRRVSLSIKQALPEWEERSATQQTQFAGGERKQREPASSSPSAPPRPKRREFQREEEAAEAPSFNADASLEAILQELKERGIGRK